MEDRSLVRKEMRYNSAASCVYTHNIPLEYNTPSQLVDQFSYKHMEFYQRTISDCE